MLLTGLIIILFLKPTEFFRKTTFKLKLKFSRHYYKVKLVVDYIM